MKVHSQGAQVMTTSSFSSSRSLLFAAAKVFSSVELLLHLFAAIICLHSAAAVLSC